MQRAVSQRRQTGEMSYHAGLAAEGAVERHYAKRGYSILDRRWRGTGGEIDLIVQTAENFIFVEVKKSGTFAQAALRVTKRQQQRIFEAANEYVALQPTGMLRAMRFDVALMSSTGEIEILENALFQD